MMKYVIVLGDGMADEPIEKLNGRTPLEVAKTPTMDEMARVAEIGLVHTVAEGISPGSDIANLSVLGYDTTKCYTGRSPLEALSIGVDMKESDVSLRCNLVTLSEEEANYEDKTIIDHSASEISTEEAAILVEALQEMLEDSFKLYVGTSYRHLLVWDQGEVLSFTAPHDILEQKIGGYLPSEQVFLDIMKKSYEILANHPINIERKKKGLNPANSAWFWGAGTKPSLEDFKEKYGKQAAMISAVDLLKGIAVGANMHNIEVEGANGGLHTNYIGKAKAAVDALVEDGFDMVYIHVEAPDEMGHQGELDDKIQAIEWLDEKVIRVVKDGLDSKGVPYRMLVLPDHPTPVAIRTHTNKPVPYMLYESQCREDLGEQTYSEQFAENTGKVFDSGCDLMTTFLN